MKIGVPREIKDNENRVALTPGGTNVLVEAGHSVHIQEGAGLGSGFPDDDYLKAGASLVSADAAWLSDLVIKVKEPLESEYRYLGEQIVFTYFHLAGVTPALTETLLQRKTTAIAYETVEDEAGKLPLLAPMSAIAGNMAVTMGNFYLAHFNRGKGMLLARVFDKRFGKAVIIGDGVVGRHSARVASAMGTDVTVIGRHRERVPALEKEISKDIHFVLSRPEEIASTIEEADLVVGAVLRRGALAPRIVTEAMVRKMQPGSVIVDVSIDQGGCVETSHPTTHLNPVFEKHGVIHYCVTNMPGAYPRLSTIALTDATLPYMLKLADNGIAALREDHGLARGLNTYMGYLTCKAVAESLDLMPRYREFS